CCREPGNRNQKRGNKFAPTWLLPVLAPVSTQLAREHPSNLRWGDVRQQSTCHPNAMLVLANSSSRNDAARIVVVIHTDLRVIARISRRMSTVHSDGAGHDALSTLDNRFAVHPPRIVHIAHWDGNALVLIASVRNITWRQKHINTTLIRHRDGTERRQILRFVEPLSRGNVRDSDRVRRSEQWLELVENVHHGLRITHV